MQFSQASMAKRVIWFVHALLLPVIRGAHAGKIVQRVAAVTGGKGGGKPDSAMAGIGKTYMVDEALLALDGIAAEFLKED